MDNYIKMLAFNIIIITLLHKANIVAFIYNYIILYLVKLFAA